MKACLGSQFEYVRGYKPAEQIMYQELAAIKTFSMYSEKVSTLRHRAAAETNF